MHLASALQDLQGVRAKSQRKGRRDSLCQPPETAGHIYSRLIRCELELPPSLIGMRHTKGWKERSILGANKGIHCGQYNGLKVDLLFIIAMS